MHLNGHEQSLHTNLTSVSPSLRPPLEWDWDVEHADRKEEAKADGALHGAHPFQVDRRVLRDVVKEKTGVDVGRITFLSSGMCRRSLLSYNHRGLTTAFVHQEHFTKSVTPKEIHMLMPNLSVGISCDVGRSWPACGACCAEVHGSYQNRIRGGYYALLA
jgi:hypothetical protein